MSKVAKPRLGRGLRSLIPGGSLPVENLPVEVELPDPAPLDLSPTPAPPPAARPVPDMPVTNAVGSASALPAPISTAPISTAPTSAAPTSANPAPARRLPDNRVSDTAAPAGQPLMLAPDRIHPNPHQPRQSLDEAKVAELAASIKSTGIIQPIVVRKTGDAYQLIAGERRWRAAKLAGLAEIPAIVREVSSYEQAQMALVENIQREDLNAIDRAASYRTLMDQLGLTQAELAGRLGEDRSSIANHLRLLELHPSVQEMVRGGDLSLGHAKLLAGVPDPLEQQRLANLVLSQELSVRNLERVLAEPAATPPTHRPAAAPSAHLAEMERTLTRQLGLRVQLKSGSKKGRGRVIIHYTDLDQFDSLLAKLGVQME